MAQLQIEKNVVISRQNGVVRLRSSNSPDEFLIDEKDYEIVKTRCWGVYGNYMEATVNKKRIKLHILLMGEKDGFVIDHANRFTLDNRRSNLRWATKSQNAMNRNKNSNNTSGYIGVYFHKSNGKYRGVIHFNKKGRNCSETKEFTTAIEAAKWRDERAKVRHGEFAVLNF